MNLGRCVEVSGGLVTWVNQLVVVKLALYIPLKPPPLWPPLYLLLP